MYYIAFVLLLTGLAALIIGLAARSIKAALGCFITLVMMAGGCALAGVIWQWWAR